MKTVKELQTQYKQTIKRGDRSRLNLRARELFEIMSEKDAVDQILLAWEAGVMAGLQAKNKRITLK